jgi:hypothetical protein
MTLSSRGNWKFLAVLALLWAGIVIGVSGLATPVKFTAPSLSLPVALDVGRVTFHWLARVEWIMAAALVLTAIVARLSTLQWLLIAIVVAVVTIQSLWLLPGLDARVTAVIRGTALPPGSLHNWYVVAEAVKIGLLLTIGITALPREQAQYRL